MKPKQAIELLESVVAQAADLKILIEEQTRNGLQGIDRATEIDLRNADDALARIWEAITT